MRRYGWLLALALLGIVSTTAAACNDDDYGQMTTTTQDLSVTETD